MCIWNLNPGLMVGAPYWSRLLWSFWSENLWWQTCVYSLFVRWLWSMPSPIGFWKWLRAVGCLYLCKSQYPSVASAPSQLPVLGVLWVLPVSSLSAFKSHYMAYSKKPWEQNRNKHLQLCSFKFLIWHLSWLNEVTHILQWAFVDIVF